MNIPIAERWDLDLELGVLDGPNGTSELSQEGLSTVFFIKTDLFENISRTDQTLASTDNELHSLDYVKYKRVIAQLKQSLEERFGDFKPERKSAELFSNTLGILMQEIDKLPPPLQIVLNLKKH